MSSSDSFWNNLQIFIDKHDYLSLLLVLVLVIASALWRWRPQDRRPIVNALSLFALAMGMLALTGVLVGLGIKPLTEQLHGFSLFLGGLAVIRLLGMFSFRIILPSCRINPLRILEDLAELILYCVWMMMQLHSLGVNLTGLVTTSAVMTAVLAFSMQDTLGNILGGLALQLDNSIKVGDWIKVDDVNGRVSDIRWRYTAIETRNWETVVIPNSALMKGKFSVIGRRSGKPLQWRRWIYFEVGFESSAGHVIDIVQAAIRKGRIANVSDNPPASCVLMDFYPSANRYALRYWLQDIEADDPTDSQVRVRLYAALQRAGIKLAYPKFNVDMLNLDDNYEHNKMMRRAKERTEALHQVDLFRTLRDDELAEIAGQLVYAPFAAGDFIMRQGETAYWFYIIINGETEVYLELPAGERRMIDTTDGYCIIGEMGLITGDPRSATVIAKTEVLAYRLDKASFQKVIENRPELAEEISKILASRRFGIENLQQQLDSESVLKMMAHQQNTFLEQIRSFFGLESRNKVSG